MNSKFKRKMRFAYIFYVGVILTALFAVAPSARAATAIPKKTEIVQPLMAIDAMKSPEGFQKVWTIPTTPMYGHGRMALRVLAKQKGTIPDPITGIPPMWYKVSLPIRPNGTVGWVSSDKVKVLTTVRYIRINRSARKVFYYTRGKLTASWPVVVGKRSTPTPKGRFGVQGKSTADHGFDGTGIIPFAYSNVHKQFDGGPGRVAMHGRSGVSFATPLGTAGSNGCVRMNNNRMERLLKELPIGTPVDVI